MTRLAYSEDLYVLLFKVGRNIVLLHDECEVHAPGFSWVGSDMSPQVQETLNDFRHAGLLEVGRHEPWGAAVTLSHDGLVRLDEWRAQRLAGVRGVA